VLSFEEAKQKSEQEIARERQSLEARSAELERCQKTWEEERTALQQRPAEPDPRLLERERALAKQEEEVAAQKQELAVLRQELADIRTQLYDRYRERRDRMGAMQESVNKAARKVQERKQQFEAELRESEGRRRAEAARHAELLGQEADLRQARQLFEEERRLHESRVTQLNLDMQRRLDECKTRENALDEEQANLVQDRERHKEELVRFARMHAEQDERQKALDDREREIEQRLEQLHGETKEMESQVVQLDEWHTKISAVGEKLAKQKTEQEQVSQQLAQRAAALEGQQAALAALRTRLERMREEARQQEQQLAEQRAHQESAEAELRLKQEAVDQLRKELEGDKTLLDQERRMLNDRAAVMDNAVAQLRQAQERVAADEQRIREQTTTLDTATAEQAEATSLLQARIVQYDELHKRLEAERENLRERSLLLAQGEQARETLQEQLRRRSEELAGRHKSMQDQVAKHEADAAALQKERDSIDELHQQHKDQLAVERQALDQRAAELERQQTELAARAAALERDRTALAEANHAFAEESKEFVEQRSKLDLDRHSAEEAARLARAEFEIAKRDVLQLQQQLPELELRAGTALERLTHGREQMREHLDEVHAYAGQCRDELDGLRAQLQAEAERVQQQELSLRRGQDEQRLAVAAFRQQLIDWQAQIADMKRLMAHDETRLEQRQEQVAEQARQLGADTVRLAQQADQLQEKEREVSHKRAEMDRHLGDMREWYRSKLRELAGVDVAEVEKANAATDGDSEAPRRDILSLTGDVDPIDRKLGDLMRSLELIEADTLTALLVEARRQRRSLRQMLLVSGTVTLYQMALIEAGNLSSLMLGPVRIVDRLRHTPRESVYRVFDPRRGADAVLRHLSEAEAKDAAHLAEFRSRFTQAMLAHPNIAATLEVIEIAARPAVLQEWLTGLPSPDWPQLSGVPGVWYRLMLQAAQALHAAHETGQVHGHLQPQHFVLTAEGILKVCGLGEPAWLVGTQFTDESKSDLTALAGIASAWCAAARRQAPRGKALPDSLQNILDRLTSTRDNAITTAATLLDELEKAAALVPVNPEAWDRTLRHVKDNAAPLATLRQSA
jgi:chromosome segregation ATPase